MVNYCLDSHRCRRSLIAEHFDEVWESASCNEMCDHCKKVSVVENIDVAFHCRSLYRIIDHAHELEIKLTAIKLMDAWFGKGDSKLRVSNIKCNFEKTTAENIIGFLLIKGYLKEDFHYTAYSTISYIKKGPKHGCLDDYYCKIPMELCSGKKKKQSSDRQNEVKATEKVDCPNEKSLKRKKECSEDVMKVKNVKVFS